MLCFKWVLSRPLKTSELEVLSALLGKQRDHYAGDGDAASALLGVGLHPRDEGFPAAEQAAWTAVARAVFHMHETITRN